MFSVIWTTKIITCKSVKKKKELQSKLDDFTSDHFIQIQRVLSLWMLRGTCFPNGKSFNKGSGIHHQFLDIGSFEKKERDHTENTG